MSRFKRILAATLTSSFLAVTASAIPAQALEVAVEDHTCSFIYTIEEQIAMRALSIEVYSVEHMREYAPMHAETLKELKEELAHMKKSGLYSAKEIKKQEDLIAAFTKFLKGAEACAKGRSYNSESLSSNGNLGGTIALIVGAIAAVFGAIAAAITYVPSLQFTTFPAFF